MGTPPQPEPRPSDVETFSLALMRALAHYARQFHVDNVDTVRLGAPPGLRTRILKRAKGLVLRAVASRGFALTRQSRGEAALDTSLLEGQLEDLARVHAGLADEASRRLLVQIVAFRMLGSQHVQLPWGLDRRYLREVESLEKLVLPGEAFDTAFMGWQLRLYDLRPLGYDLRVLNVPLVIMNTFRIRQYEYRAEGVHIIAPPGRAVIDCGGCWGDTALYFADVTQARVFTYEFVDSNLRFMRRNLELNPRHGALVTVVENAVWSVSGNTVWVEDAGPASRISAVAIPGGAEVRTLSIDDLVARELVPDVGLIKMDIEGAERDALEGARETIARHRPILAIAAYHRRDDLVALPALIGRIGPRYRFFLGHYTMHAEETVLFAVPAE